MVEEVEEAYQKYKAKEKGWFKPFRGKDVIRYIESLGFKLIRQKGDHKIYGLTYEKDNVTHRPTLPIPNRDLSAPEIKKIFKELEGILSKFEESK